MKLSQLVIRIVVGFLIPASNTCVCYSQLATTGRPSFETTAIHQDDPGSAGGFHMTRIRFYDDGLRADHVSVRTLIAFAYDMDEDEIEGGPSWVGSDSYEIVATYGETNISAIKSMSVDARRDLQREMLISLLVDRFGLHVERSETKGSVYAVLVSKGGTKMRPSSRSETFENGVKDLDGAPAGSGFVGYRFVGGAVDIPAQAGHLSQLIRRLNTNARPLFLDRKIVDGTGLSGAYDFELTFSVPWIGHVPDASEIEALDGNTGSTLGESLRQQLGLELQPQTGTVPVLIVKSLNRPSEN